MSAEDWPELRFFYERNVAVTLRRDEPATPDVASPLDSARQDVFASNGSGADVESVAVGCLRGDGEAVRLITTERDGYGAERYRLSERFIGGVALLSVRITVPLLRSLWRSSAFL